MGKSTASTPVGPLSLRWLVHQEGSGQCVAALTIRTWRGSDSWDRRLVPSRPLGTPPAPPPGVESALWTVYWCALRCVLAAADEAQSPRAARRHPPFGGSQGGRSDDGQPEQLELPLGLEPPPAMGRVPERSEGSVKG